MIGYLGIVSINIIYNPYCSACNRGVGIAWTTPLVATMGSSLCIPMAMMEDMLIHGQHYSALYVLGSVMVNKIPYFFSKHNNQSLIYEDINYYIPQFLELTLIISYFYFLL